MHLETAFAAISFSYQNRMAFALEQHRAGVPLVGFTSNTVPWELIRASGAFPILVSPAATPALSEPDIERWMEPTFDSRIRAIFHATLKGDWSFLKLLVIPRTSEPEYKLYLYLREMVRQGRGAAVPPVYLYDLLHTRSVRSRKYGRERTEDFRRHLEKITGQALLPERIRVAAEESNAARGAIRRLLRLRGPARTKLSGADAITAIGASYFMDRGQYSKVAGEFADEVAQRPPVSGPKLLISGFPVDHPNLHRLLESHGAMVVAEDDWWGSRAAGRDIPGAADPLAACFAKYYLDAPSPRVYPPSAADRWFQRTAQKGIDGVVFYHPPDDDVYGWDYPRHREFLNRLAIPSLRIREDCCSETVSPQLHREIAAFVAEASENPGRSK